jgi:hypothetical protein
MRGVGKELFSRLNQIYYWKSFRKTHENYNYLQLTLVNKTGNFSQKIIKVQGLIKLS